MEILTSDSLLCIISHPKLIVSAISEQIVTLEGCLCCCFCILLYLLFSFLFFIYLWGGSGAVLLSFECPLPVNRAIMTLPQMRLRYTCAKSDASLELSRASQ